MDERNSEHNDQGTGRLVRGLGWFSVGLGTMQLLRPDAVNRFVGVRNTPRNRAVMAGVGGLRELAVGAGMLGLSRPAPLVWARVAGDVGDLVLLSRALPNRRNTRGRVMMALCAVAGVTAADVLAGVRLGRSGRAPDRRRIRVRAAITVLRPANEVYSFWRELENLPRFMAHLESVRTEGTRSWWRAKAPAGMQVEWQSELIADTADELIAWRSTPGADVPNSGSVRFTPAPGGAGTEVVVELEYAPIAGRLGAAVAKLFGQEPGQQIKDDLRRFKQVMETGEVVRSDGSPDGVSTGRQRRQRPARPSADLRGPEAAPDAEPDRTQPLAPTAGRE